MFETIKMFMEDSIQMKSEDHIEPHLEQGEEDYVAGKMPDYIRAMYTICRKMEKTRDTYNVDMKYMTLDKRKQCEMHYAEIEHAFFITYQILIFETRSFFNLWDKHQILFFTGYRAGYRNPPDFEKLGIKIVGGII